MYLTSNEFNFKSRLTKLRAPACRHPLISLYKLTYRDEAVKFSSVIIGAAAARNHAADATFIANAKSAVNLFLSLFYFAA